MSQMYCGLNTMSMRTPRSSVSARCFGPTAHHHFRQVGKYLKVRTALFPDACTLCADVTLEASNFSGYEHFPRCSLE